MTGNWQLASSGKVTVKQLREVLLARRAKAVKPSINNNKFELGDVVIDDHNPFITVRKALIAPRDRFFKYRILHGDVFCNSRMFKFKMVNSPLCNYCVTEIDTIKHVLWDCPRSSRAWEYLREQTRIYLGNTDYIT